MNIVSSLLASNEADVVFGHMVEMAVVVTRLVVEFAKHLPGFQTLSKDDQIALLKARYVGDSLWMSLSCELSQSSLSLVNEMFLRANKFDWVSQEIEAEITTRGDLFWTELGQAENFLITLVLSTNNTWR